MIEKFNEFESHFIIVNIPLEVCKISRSSRKRRRLCTSQQRVLHLSELTLLQI